MDAKLQSVHRVPRRPPVLLRYPRGARRGGGVTLPVD